jgi:hypothetical protein
MRTDDFFQEVSDGFFGLESRFRTELAESLIRGRVTSAPDVEAGVALADLVHQSLVACGTAGSPDLPAGDALRALKAILDRLRVSHSIPWRNYEVVSLRRCK